MTPILILAIHLLPLPQKYTFILRCVARKAWHENDGDGGRVSVRQLTPYSEKFTIWLLLYCVFDLIPARRTRNNHSRCFVFAGPALGRGTELSLLLLLLLFFA